MADDQVVEAPENPEPGDGGPAHARSRGSGWRTALVVVGVLVLVAAAGAGGVLYGRDHAPGPDIVVQPEPVVEASTLIEPMPVGVLPGPPSPTPEATPAATPLPSPTAPVLAVGVGEVAAWPVALSASPGLADTPGTATGYRLVSSGISGAQVAAVLGSTFGASGDAVAVDGAWTVGSAGGPTLTVQDDPLFTWRFEDPALSASPAPGKQIDPAAAVELTDTLLGSIGVDTASVDWQVDRYFAFTEVIAWQLVAGERSQLSWRIAYAPDGAILSASGFSAGLEAVPGYPVVGAATAVTRSQTPPWSAIAPALVQGAVVDPTATASPSPSAVDKPGVVVPVSDVVVVDAVLGLAQFWQPDGGVLMLPAYELVGEDGSRWTLLAIDEPYVQFADLPYPTPDPTAS